MQHKKIKQLESLVQKQIIGQEKLVNRLLIAILADGHLLVEGCSRTGKNPSSKSIRGKY